MIERKLEGVWLWEQMQMNTSVWDTQSAQGKNLAYSLDFKVVWLVKFIYGVYFRLIKLPMKYCLLKW